MNAMLTDAALVTHQARAATRGRHETDATSRAGERIAAIGGGILRYGLVGILLYLGTFKFTMTEAEWDDVVRVHLRGHLPSAHSLRA